MSNLKKLKTNATISGTKTKTVNIVIEGKTKSRPARALAFPNDVFFLMVHSLLLAERGVKTPLSALILS